MKYALKFAGSVLSFHILFCIMYYFFCSKAQVPINVASINVAKVQKSNQNVALFTNFSFMSQIILDYAFIEVPLSFLMACTLHIVVLGSFLFVFLAGYGLAYAPLEYLNDFLNRPQIVNF